MNMNRFYSREARHDCFVNPLLLMFTRIMVGNKVFGVGLCQ